MISREDKAPVLGIKIRDSTPGGDEVPLPPVKNVDTDRGLPLYSAERK